MNWNRISESCKLFGYKDQENEKRTKKSDPKWFKIDGLLARYFKRSLRKYLAKSDYALLELIHQKIYLTKKRLNASDKTIIEDIIKRTKERQKNALHLGFVQKQAYKKQIEEEKDKSAPGSLVTVRRKSEE